MISEDDPQFRITPLQQMASACSGALITSLFMTPLDVVKIRLQAQQKALMSNKSHVHSNCALTPLDSVKSRFRPQRKNLQYNKCYLHLYCAVTPLDVVKIRLQAQQKALLSNRCYLYCNGLMEHLCPCGETAWIPKRVHFNGTFDAFYKISKLEGVSALWSGLSPTLVLALPCTVIYFVSYEQLRYKMKTAYNQFSGTKNQPMWIPLVAGATARTIAVTVVSPLELIRTKMQSKKLSYSDIRSALVNVIKFEGYTGLFRGLGSTLLRDVPFSGIYWTTFESTKIAFNRPDSEKNTFLFNFFCGSVAGSLAALVTLPFDVVKTHQQIELGEKEIYAEGNSKQKASSMKDIVKNIYRNHGFRGLFTGLLPRVFKVAPACAIMIATFEYGKQFFRKYNSEQYAQIMQRHQDIVLTSTRPADYS